MFKRRYFGCVVVLIDDKRLTKVCVLIKISQNTNIATLGA